MRQQPPPLSPAGMEQEPGVAAFIPLNEHEQRYYSGLHSLCQADASGKLSSGKVAELFKASQLPAESLHKVSPAARLRLQPPDTRTCGPEPPALCCALGFWTGLRVHICRVWVGVCVIQG